MFVVDTDVLSLTSPASKLDTEAVARWREWVRRNRQDIFLSSITIMEVRFGIENLRARGAEARAMALRQWLLAAETVHAHRVVPVSTEIAHAAGALLHRAFRNGGKPESEDALIAATAASLGFRLLSRNAKHMGLFGVDFIDPLSNLPG